MVITPLTYAVAAAGVFLIAFLRGAFGGGFGLMGIPLLALVIDPVTAGALLAPLFVVTDLCALRYWKPGSWSKPDLARLLPGLVVGEGIGYLALESLSERLIASLMAVIVLLFVALWLKGGGRVVVRPRSTVKALLAGTASGLTSMVAHSGGPPLALYLLSLGLPKALYAGTTSLFFSVANALKVVPWLLLGHWSGNLFWLTLLCLPAVPIGVWAGWHLHQRLDQQSLYRLCYGLLTLTALKLLWDGVMG